MMRNYRLEILTLCAVIVFCIIFLYTDSTMNGAGFSGTDAIAAEKIQYSSPTQNGTIQPIIPQWVPPSGEIEAALFALQAAIGGLVIGGVFGYWIGQKK